MTSLSIVENSDSYLFIKDILVKVPVTSKVAVIYPYYNFVIVHLPSDMYVQAGQSDFGP